jgi:dipeptidase D
MAKFGNIAPALLWQQFEAFCNIPRPSKKETAICNYIKKCAKDRGLTVREDAMGDLVVCIPATKGFENAPSVVMQNHVDMVTEKNAATQFDFDTQGIDAYVDGEWIRARGTTLGADNGIGCAAALALMDDTSCTHGPLELLFTVDEETGLSGATNLDGSMIKSKIMLNLDSEEEGIFYIGCAGGATGNLKCSAPMESTQGLTSLSVSVSGLLGGHSGLNIVDNRGNALKLLARALNAANAVTDIRIVSFEGGSKHNAIPREAFAHVKVETTRVTAIKEAISQAATLMKKEFGQSEASLNILCENAKDEATHAKSKQDTKRFINYILSFAHGVHTMSRDLPGLVETSSNLAIVRTTQSGFEIVTSVRSSIAEAKVALMEEISSSAILAGCQCEFGEGYPAWRPDPKSALLARSSALWQKKTGKAPHVTAIHAGLECGVILEKCPGLDVISFGPDIRGAHSPDECVHIESTKRFYDFLKELLEEIARKPL